MTAVELGLAAQPLLALGTVGTALAAPDRARNPLAAAGCALVAGAGVLTGALAMAGHTGSLRLPTALPWSGPLLAPDRLGGLFMLLVAAVGLVVALYAAGYAHGPAASRTAWSALALFLLGMQMVPAAGDVVALLAAWELMAVASTVLVLTDHADRPVARSAAAWYAVMTHVSFLLLLAGLAVLAAAAGATDLALMAGAGGATADLAFVLLVLGAGCKAGLVPLHVWLPRAHAEAPSHVSAAMSAGMVALGLYVALLATTRLLPAGPAWWGVALMALGGVSALFGILQASVTTDLKRLLAYSTSENMGLMFLALGAAELAQARGRADAAGVALTACLLLAVSHAAFKAGLFMAAGAVVGATGERSLDRLGGLAARMPWTAGAFGVAALGAAALPVTCGFVAEWTLLQALVHGGGSGDRLAAIVLPAAVAVVALTAGLALLAFTKAAGIGFLARPRSEGAATCSEAGWSMRAGMVLAGLAVVLLGLLPGPVATALAEAVGADGVAEARAGGLALDGIGATLAPAGLVVTVLVLLMPVLVVGAVSARRRPARTAALPWGCGGARTSPRMQYTATSYAEPLVRVFGDALRPSRDLDVVHAPESRFLVREARFRQRLTDVVEARLYAPLLAGAEWVGERARGLQNGSIHRYLAYAFAALVAVLVAVTL